MSPATHVPTHPAKGLVIGLLSALAYAFAGIFGKPLLQAGWSPTGVIVVRAGLGALLLAPLVVAAMHGQWHLARRAWPTLLLYGALGVMTPMLGFYLAVQTLPVGLTLMIEYLCVIGVVVWMWLRHAVRPGTLAVGGMVMALAGLAVVLDLVGELRGGGAGLDLRGVLFALCGMAGLVVYYVLSARDTTGLPPLGLAGIGLMTGTLLTLAVSLCAGGVLPLRVAGGDAVLAGHAVPSWLLAVGLGVVAAAAAYSLGIVAGRLLGPTVASFVGLAEVLFGMALAWLLMGEGMTAVQLAGAALVMTGVALVRWQDLLEARRAPRVPLH